MPSNAWHDPNDGGSIQPATGSLQTDVEKLQTCSLVRARCTCQRTLAGDVLSGTGESPGTCLGMDVALASGGMVLQEQAPGFCHCLPCRPAFLAIEPEVDMDRERPGSHGLGRIPLSALGAGHG